MDIMNHTQLDKMHMKQNLPLNVQPLITQNYFFLDISPCQTAECSNTNKNSSPGQCLLCTTQAVAIKHYLNKNDNKA